TARRRPLTWSECNGLPPRGRGFATARDKPGVEAHVWREFWMERRGDQISLAGGDDAAVRQGGERFRLRAEALHRRRADEHRMEGVIHASERQVDLEAIDLPTEGIALDGQIHQPDAP